jgi:hypothetical protein
LADAFQSEFRMSVSGAQRGVNKGPYIGRRRRDEA